MKNGARTIIEVIGFVAAIITIWSAFGFGKSKIAEEVAATLSEDFGADPEEAKALILQGKTTEVLQKSFLHVRDFTNSFELPVGKSKPLTDDGFVLSVRRLLTDRVQGGFDGKRIDLQIGEAVSFESTAGSCKVFYIEQKHNNPNPAERDMKGSYYSDYVPVFTLRCSQK